MFYIFSLHILTIQISHGNGDGDGGGGGGANSRYKSSGGGHSPASTGLHGSLSLINIYICMNVVNTIYKHSILMDL
jgi:hypothetical protein